MNRPLHNGSSVLLAAAAFLISLSTAPADPVAEDVETPANEGPEVFTDFADAVHHAKLHGLKIFIACLKPGDTDSDTLAASLSETKLYLNGEKVVIYQYDVEDDARISSFRSHFGIEDDGMPIVVVTDSSGKPIGHKTGLLAENEYHAFIENTAGFAALALPSKVRIKRNIAATLRAAASKTGKYHTPMRTWTLVTGEKIEGAVVSSTSDQLTLETKDGDTREVPAFQLSRPDVEYLQKTLGSKKDFP